MAADPLFPALRSRERAQLSMKAAERAHVSCGRFAVRARSSQQGRVALMPVGMNRVEPASRVIAGEPAGPGIEEWLEMLVAGQLPLDQRNDRSPICGICSFWGSWQIDLKSPDHL